MEAETLQAMRDALANVPGLAFAYLHGSHAEGRPRADSDVDVAFLTVEGRTEKHRKIRDTVFHRLAEIVGSHRLDLCDLEDAGDLLRYEVVRKGQLLLCQDRTRWGQFYVATLGRYFDSIHYRRILGDAVRKRIKTGEGPWSTSRSPRAA